LTNLFARELKKSNPSVNFDISDVERLKEQYACCTEDQLAFEAIESSCQPERHTLPDGQVGYSTLLLCKFCVVVPNIHIGPLLMCDIDCLHKMQHNCVLALFVDQLSWALIS
jgi:hypothetical protein